MTFTILHAALMAAIMFGAIMLAFQRGTLQGMKDAQAIRGTPTTAIGDLTIKAAIPETVQRKGKFYITGGRTEDARGYRDDCAVPPLVGHGTDRLDALANSGLTVWTEDEWNEAAMRNFRKSCKGTDAP